ncbi:MULTISPECIES: hypothetical protein [unclassified Moorena]|uniref:hypothetical protein n=1 Tax=unclassified Moorena TaxID=2683338 RepID=UPI0013B70B9F|nr:MULTISPECIES: hypothetical protein [unclassified Moorena]NEP36880.1 hypothetical protein [Moorena sp. SIO3B2]NEP66406.1 hypothetical protein [Moorena sp. SIO3A5]NEQ05906.1 hypothetical protein [Moorena sp. SIO4E2]NES43034.1 hypothetical protein [Moorena sp. SIO2C4]
MTDDKMQTLSSFAKDEYGLSSASFQAMVNYGYALLAIAGGDGEVSDPEMEWLINHQTRFGAPEEVVGLYQSFDYKNANLQELLPDIKKVDVETLSVANELVYHAIKMSSADGVYADAERAKVKEAAKILGVADDIVLTLESLVEMERTVVKMRKALIHVNTL